MNYFCDSGGVIFHVDTERVFQGSANANVINFFGAFPSNAEVLIAYELPDKTWTTPNRMTPIAQLSSVLDEKGNAYAGWQTRIGATLRMENGAPVKDENGDYVYDFDYTVTEKYGTVGVQFFVYANGGNSLGSQIASARSSFVVEKGNPIVLPDTPTDDYEVLLGQILGAISDVRYVQEKVESATESATKAEQAAQTATEQATQAAQTAAELKESTDKIDTLQAEKVDKSGDTMTGALRIEGGGKSAVYGAEGITVLAEGEPTTVSYPDKNGTMALDADIETAKGEVLQAAKEYTDQELATFDFIKVVKDLPETGLPNKIYLVPKTTAADNDFFDTYIWANKGTEEEPDYVWDFQGTKKVEVDLTNYVKFTDYATRDKAGVSCVDKDFDSVYGGIFMSTLGGHNLIIRKARYKEIDKRFASDYIDGGANGANACSPIVPANLDYSIISVLTNPLIEMTDEGKTKACDWLGAVKKGTSDDVLLADGATMKWDYGTLGGSLIRRYSNGSARVNMPDKLEDETEYDIVNRHFLSQKIAELGAGGGIKLYRHTVKLYDSELGANKWLTFLSLSPEKLIIEDYDYLQADPETGVAPIVEGLDLSRGFEYKVINLGGTIEVDYDIFPALVIVGVNYNLNIVLGYPRPDLTQYTITEVQGG